MLSSEDCREAVRRYKNIKLDGHERQRCHALILVQQEYSYCKIAEILLVDDGTVSRVYILWTFPITRPKKIRKSKSEKT
jgi:hypothetical protein